MFLTDFRTQKYTGGIISRVGIFLTVTPARFVTASYVRISTLTAKIIAEVSNYLNQEKQW